MNKPCPPKNVCLPAPYTLAGWDTNASVRLDRTPTPCLPTWSPNWATATGLCPPSCLTSITRTSCRAGTPARRLRPINWCTFSTTPRCWNTNWLNQRGRDPDPQRTRPSRAARHETPPCSCTPTRAITRCSPTRSPKRWLSCTASTTAPALPTASSACGINRHLPTGGQGSALVFDRLCVRDDHCQRAARRHPCPAGVHRAGHVQKPSGDEARHSRYFSEVSPMCGRCSMTSSAPKLPPSYSPSSASFESDTRWPKESLASVDLNPTTIEQIHPVAAARCSPTRVLGQSHRAGVGQCRFFTLSTTGDCS